MKLLYLLIVLPIVFAASSYADGQQRQAAIVDHRRSLAVSRDDALVVSDNAAINSSGKPGTANRRNLWQKRPRRWSSHDSKDFRWKRKQSRWKNSWSSRRKKNSWSHYSRDSWDSWGRASSGSSWSSSGKSGKSGSKSSSSSSGDSWGWSSESKSSKSKSSKSSSRSWSRGW